MNKIAREIKQIAVCEAGCSNGYSYHVIALCSDDTIWELDLSGTEQKWKQLPPIPEH